MPWPPRSAAGRRWCQAARTAHHLRRRRPGRALRGGRGRPRTSMRCARRCGAAPCRLRRNQLRRTGSAVFVLGRGSNLLVADAGFDGIGPAARVGVLRPRACPGRGRCRRGGGGPGRRAAPAPPSALPVLARRVADAGWRGLSWAVGVPGSVGGAVRMNAGGHGSDMASCLVRYRWVDLLQRDRWHRRRRTASRTATARRR